MHPSAGDIVYYLPEVFVVKSQMPSGVFRVEGLVSKTRKVAAVDTLYPVTLVRRAEIDDEGLSVLRNKNAELITERQSVVYQLDALKAEILSWQKKADISDGQLHLWKEAANQRQQSLTEYKETSKKLGRQVDSIEADYAAEITAIEESRSQEQILVEELQLQGEAINGLERELETRETFKMGDKLTLYDQLMVSSNASVETIAKRFKKLSLFCNPDHGGSYDVFVQLQRAHRILSDPEARLRYEAEGCEAAEEFLSFKNNSKD